MAHISLLCDPLLLCAGFDVRSTCGFVMGPVSSLSRPAGKKIFLDFGLELKQDSHSVPARLVEALAMVVAIASASTMEIPHLPVNA
ncbi:unnamed protein product [Arabis nemorensis]|uniref:Non-specific serine/threonine protein kinase n=1 Tax=Arabis nemorensis TaxID=586526 RepID=A0A565BES5_9BRAS|nr:unnamed protein product [Arabis nemorensis]